MNVIKEKIRRQENVTSILYEMKLSMEAFLSRIIGMETNDPLGALDLIHQTYRFKSYLDECSNEALGWLNCYKQASEMNNESKEDAVS